MGLVRLSIENRWRGGKTGGEAAVGGNAGILQRLRLLSALGKEGDESLSVSWGGRRATKPVDYKQTNKHVMTVVLHSRNKLMGEHRVG